MGPTLRTITLGYLMPLGSARALRGAGILVVLLLGLIVTGKALGFVHEEMLLALRGGLVIPGVPIAAALLSEISLREGITQRTLLYPLFGPVSRQALAVGRTLLTALLLVLGAIATSLALQGLAGVKPAGLGREILGLCFGGLTYVALFGLLHLVSNRGLVTGLALFFTLDDPLGRLPFSLRLLAPSFHLRTISGVEAEFNLPIDVHPATSTPLMSSLALVVIGALAIYATAQLFARKPLGELC